MGRLVELSVHKRSRVLVALGCVALGEGLFNIRRRLFQRQCVLVKQRFYADGRALRLGRLFGGPLLESLQCVQQVLCLFDAGGNVHDNTGLCFGGRYALYPDACGLFVEGRHDVLSQWRSDIYQTGFLACC